MGGIGASAPGPAKPTLPAYTSSRLSAASTCDLMSECPASLYRCTARMCMVRYKWSYWNKHSDAKQEE